MSLARITSPPAGTPWAVVIQTEQFDHSADVVVASDADAYPARIGKDVVRLGTPRIYELITNHAGKGKIRKSASMQMPELAASNAEFDTAEPVRSGNHTFPG